MHAFCAFGFLSVHSRLRWAKKKKLRNKCQGINIACILLTALDSSDNGGRTEQYILVEVTAFHSSSFLEQLTHSHFQKSK